MAAADVLDLDPGAWGNFKPDRLFAFPGYGPEPRLQPVRDGTQVHVSPHDGQRMKAARVFDDVRHVWDEADGQTQTAAQ